MKRFFIATLVGLAVAWALSVPLCAQAHAVSPTFKLTAASLAGLAAADVVQSVPCLHSARCREVNPLYARLSPAGFVAVKAGAVGAVVAVAWRMQRSSRKRDRVYGWLLLGGMTGLQAWVVAQNARVRVGR